MVYPSRSKMWTYISLKKNVIFSYGYMLHAILPQDVVVIVAGAGLLRTGTLEPAGANGMVKKKVEPLPSSDSTQMRPWWASTIDLEIYNPNPVPLEPMARLELTR